MDNLWNQHEIPVLVNILFSDIEFQQVDSQGWEGGGKGVRPLVLMGSLASQDPEQGS